MRKASHQPSTCHNSTFCSEAPTASAAAALFSSAKAYYTFLSALLREDPSLLTPASYHELFRPQLNEELEQAFNEYLVLSESHTNFLGLRTPTTMRKTWSFAGMMAKDPQEGRFKEGTTFCARVPSTIWFIDRAAGICGTVLCQILPPLHPVVVELHEKFQRGIYEEVHRDLDEASSVV